MDFIAEIGYDVKRGRMTEFQEWLRANEKEMAQSMPDGVEYLGTYIAVHTSEKHTGAVKTLMRLDSYGAQDRLAEAGHRRGTYAQLMTELTDFIDQDADWSNVLMKAVVDATLFDVA